jgi:hypothetical protein
LSLLSAQNAGQTGINRITQAVFSTLTWYAFAGQVNNRRSLLMIGWKSGCRPKTSALAIRKSKIAPRACCDCPDHSLAERTAIRKLCFLV